MNEYNKHNAPPPQGESECVHVSTQQNIDHDKRMFKSLSCELNRMFECSNLSNLRVLTHSTHVGAIIGAWGFLEPVELESHFQSVTRENLTKSLFFGLKVVDRSIFSNACMICDRASYDILIEA